MHASGQKTAKTGEASSVKAGATQAGAVWAERAGLAIEPQHLASNQHMQRRLAAQTGAAHTLPGGGRPLEPGLRREMEGLFGQDFSGVRIHADAEAARAAQRLNARAYAVGPAIVMSDGRFAPATSEGRRLLAHELTHVVQAGSRGMAEAAASPAALEAEARRVAAAMQAGRKLPPIMASATGLGVPLLDGPDDPNPPTFGNLPREEADTQAKRVLLAQKDGVWYEMRSRNQMFRAEGSYDFVLQKGKIWAVRPKSKVGGPNPGHTEAAAGGRVEYAGTVKFGRKDNSRGVVQEWSNASGHYAPVRDPAFARATGFPLDEDLPFEKRRFKPVEGGFPDKGPQLPVQQPRTRPRDGGPPKVPPGPPLLEALEAKIAEQRKPPAPEPPATTKIAQPPVATKTVEPPVANKTAEQPAAETPKPPTTKQPAVTPPTVKPTAETTTETSTGRQPSKPRTPETKGPETKGPETKGPETKGPETKKPAPKTPPPTTTGGTGGPNVASTASEALQRTWSALSGRYTAKLSKSIAAQDKEMGAFIADMNRLLDAETFIRNPKQFSANFVASYMINGAFAKYARQLGEARARFFSTYPDVSAFSQQPLGSGMTLTTLRLRYEQSQRNLRVPDARKTLITAFAMLGLNENTTQAEIDQRIAFINAALARQPKIGGFVKQFTDAKADYAFGLALVRTKIDTLRHQLADLPRDFADDLRRRGDALISASKILEDFYNDMFPLSALPGAASLLYLLLQVSEGLAGLGGGLRTFAAQAGARQGEYLQEMARLEQLADRLAKIRGPFDIINPPPGR